WIVLRPESGRAFEHHVLEEMGNAGDAGPFVGAADVGHPAAGDGRIVVALDHEDAKAVGQSLLDDIDFFCQSMRKTGRKKSDKAEESPSTAWRERERTNEIEHGARTSPIDGAVNGRAVDNN